MNEKKNEFQIYMMILSGISMLGIMIGGGYGTIMTILSIWAMLSISLSL